MTLVLATRTAPVTPRNVIAQTTTGRTDEVVMSGAHLDSVPEGPGINDNGSGSAAILEVALAIAKEKPTLTKGVRFGWWSDEEAGTRGSRAYVNSLSSAARTNIEVYLNADMIGSSNPGYFVYDDTPSVKTIFDEYFGSIGLQTVGDTEGDGRSDHASFKSAGIPVSGVASGAGAIKTSAQARMWGGTANQAFDACYHRACDTTVNATALDRHTDALAFATWRLLGLSTTTTTGTAPTTPAGPTTPGGPTAPGGPTTPGGPGGFPDGPGGFPGGPGGFPGGPGGFPGGPGGFPGQPN